MEKVDKQKESKTKARGNPRAIAALFDETIANRVICVHDILTHHTELEWSEEKIRKHLFPKHLVNSSILHMNYHTHAL